MRQVNGISTSPKSLRWFDQFTSGRISNIFLNAVNLFDEGNHLFSIVTQEVGNGPFSFVVDNDDLSKLVKITDQISKQGEILIIGKTAFSFGQIKIWQPVPDWQTVRKIGKTDLIKEIDHQLRHASFTQGMAEVFYPVRELNKSKFYSKMQSGSGLLISGLAEKETEKIMNGSELLAGLGVGLTPSGDDFLMGLMYGLWASLPEKDARSIAELIFASAAGQTTALSREWLAAVVHGEVNERWHTLFSATIHGQGALIAEAVKEICVVGATSGVDALCGFVQALKLKDMR